MSTAVAPTRACTRPRTASTRRSSTGTGSVTSSSRPGSRVRRQPGRPDLRRHRTARRRDEHAGRWCSATAGTAGAPGSRQIADNYGDTARLPRPAARRGRNRRRDRDAVALVHGPDRRRRPHGRAGRRGPAAAPRRWASGPGRRPRPDPAHVLTGSTGASRRGAATAGRHPARPGPAGGRPRPEHQRLDPAHRPRPGRHRRSRSPTASGSTRPATSPGPPRRRPDLTGGARCRPARSTGWSSAGGDGDVFEPRHTTHGFQYVRIEGHPGRLDSRRRHRRRRPHRPAPHRLVPLQRRAAQPLPRDRGLELPGQRLRRPDRLPAPRAGRLDRRLAAVRPDRGVPLRRRRLLRRSGCATSRPTSGPTARSRTSAPIRTGRGDPEATASTFLQRLGRLGRRRRASCRGSCTGPTATTAVLDELWPAMVRWVDYAERPRARTGTRAAWRALDRAGAARALPVGHRLPLGRVARARRRARTPAGRRRQGRRRHRVPPPLQPPLVARIGRLLGHDAEADRLEQLARTTSATPGAPSTSTPTDRSRPTPRPTTCGRSPSASCPDDLAAADRGPPRRADPSRPAPTSAPASSPRRSCCRCSPTPATSTSPTSCCSRTRRRRGWHMVDRGATTVWEDWDGVAADGTRRRVAQPLQQGRGHLVPAPLHRGHPAARRRPGYRRFRVAPQPRRRAHVGRGRARLAVRPDRVVVAYRRRPVPPRVVVPPGTTAEVVLPDGTRNEQTPGVARYECALG